MPFALWEQVTTQATCSGSGRRSRTCVLCNCDYTGTESGMGKLFGIFGLVLTLATMIVAPVQDAYAAVAAAASPVMRMADGAPCRSQDCARMPDCPMALPCLSVAAALVAPIFKPVFQPVVQTIRFAILAHPALPSLEGGGLRRPPKI